MQRESLIAELRRLDPETRAFLELWLRHGLDDELIGQALGTSREAVARGRETAVREFASGSGLRRDEVSDQLRKLRFDEWPAPAGAPAPPASASKAPAVAPTPAGDGAAGRTSATRAEPVRRRRLGGLLASMLLVAAVAVAVIALATGGEEEPERGSSEGGARPGDAAAAPSRPVALEPPAGARVRGAGSAAVTGSGEDRRLRLSIRGLPDDPGIYRVWLYNSIIDSRPLGRLREAGSTLSAPLPEGFERYRFVDVSLEARGAGQGHSGRSVLRVPVDRLVGR